MANITYANKDKTATLGTAARTWRDIDANEVKDVVNNHRASKVDGLVPLAELPDAAKTILSALDFDDTGMLNGFIVFWDTGTGTFRTKAEANVGTNLFISGNTDVFLFDREVDGDEVTLLVGLDEQLAGHVLIAPETATGTPTFRRLVVSDIPGLEGFITAQAVASLDTVEELPTFVRGDLLTILVRDQYAGGIFDYQPESAGLIVNSDTIFTAQDGGYWVKRFESTLYNDVTDETISSDVDNVTIVNFDSKRFKLSSYNSISKRYGAETNVWIKMAEFDLGSQSNQDFAATLQITTSHARNQSITLFVSARNATSGNAPFFMNVDLLNFNNGTAPKFFNADSFKLLNAGFGSVYELWGKKVTTSGRYAIKELNLVSGGTVARTYFNFQAHQVSEPTATYEFRSSALIVSSDSQSAQMISPFTGKNIYYRRSITYVDGSTIVDGDADGIVTIKKYGVFFNVARSQVNMLDLGAATLADATALFTKVLTKIVNIGEVYCPEGFYRVRNLAIPTERVLRGSGEKTIFRMARTNDADNAEDYVIRSSGPFNEIRDLRIDGEGLVGNGLLLVPGASTEGFKRTNRNLIIGGFAGYVASPSGTGYGIAGNYARADLENVIGGNGVICQTAAFDFGSSWELLIDTIRISTCDGIGLDVGNSTDSKFLNIWIGDCIQGGFLMSRDNQNNQLSNIKVYRCRMPKIPIDFATSIHTLEPYSTSPSSTNAAVVLTGANNQIANIESQENGDNGFLIGTNNFSLRFSTVIGLVADGNGGIIEGDVNNADYRRSGVLFRNYFHIKVQGVSQDFRAKVNKPRQQLGFSISNTRPFISDFEDMRRGMWYKIKSVAGGADFTTIQGTDLLTKSNVVGFNFMACADFDDDLDILFDTAMGTGGELEAINDYLFLDIIVKDNFDQIANEGTGYVLGALPGDGSKITVNGENVLITT
jgi:hypothetical protein